MIKEITMGEARVLGMTVLNNWESQISNIQLSGKALYNLIGIKRELEQCVLKIQETVSTLAKNVGGEPQDNGSFKIPEDKVDELNTQLQEFNEEKVEIQYSPVKVGEKDNLPPIFMDALFDFIEID